MIRTDGHKADVSEYINAVTRRRLVVSRYVRLAVERHKADMKASRRKAFPYKFDQDAAEYAIDFLQLCPQSKGRWANVPLTLEPWQKFIIWNVFGWRRKSDGLRRFRKAYITLGRKNGKSTLCAAIGLLLAMRDRPIEGGAEVYVVATKEDQAKIVWQEAVRMCRKEYAFRKRVELFQKSISFKENDGVFRPLGSDSDQSGFNPHGVIKDELHAWRPRHRNLHDEMSTGGAARQQSLELIITTAGNEDSTIWHEEHDFACQILEGIKQNQATEAVFAYIAQLDKDDDPYDPGNWIKANPNLGVSVSEQYLTEQAEEAKAKPSAHNAFLRYHCNIAVKSEERAVKPEYWIAGKVDQLDEFDVAFGGIDLGRSDDWAGLAVVGAVDGRYQIYTEQFTAAERRKELLSADVQRWIDAGYLHEHPGNQIDFTAIEQRVVQLQEQYRIVNWAIDPTFAMQLGQRLLEQHGIEVYEFIQTARSYNEAIRAFLRDLAAAKIEHIDNPALDFQAYNLTIKPNAKDEWMPAKGNQASKIDAMVAALMAYAGHLFHEKQPTGEFYEQNELEVF